MLIGCTSTDQQSSSKKITWQAISKNLQARAGAALVEHNNFVYLIGGVDGKNYLNSVEFAYINAQGELSAWQFTREMPQARGFIDAVVFANHVYVAGGANGQHGKNLLSTVIRAPINTDGSLGMWQQMSETMLVPRRCNKLFLWNKQLIAAGGFAGSLLDTLEASHFDHDGFLGEWRLLENKLLVPRYVNAIKQSGDYVYVLGGHHASLGKGLDSVEYLALKNNNSPWMATQAMSQSRYGHSVATNGKFLYALGGMDAATYLESIEYSELMSDGTLGSWKIVQVLPQAMANFTTLIKGSWIYIFGGAYKETYNQQVYRALIHADGRIGFEGGWAEPQTLQIQSNRNENLTRSGRVLEVINSPQYSFIQLIESNGQTLWIASNRIPLEPEQRIRFSEGALMKHFFSASLNRQFDEIVFVSAVKALD